MLTKKFRLPVAFVVLCLVFGISCLTKKSNRIKERCTDSVRDGYDADIARLMSIGPHGRPWPTNIREHSEYCSETRRLNQRMDNFKTVCASGTSKEFSSVILYSIRRATKLHCRPASKQNRRLERMFATYTCTNKLSNQTGTCLDGYIGSLKEIINVPVKRQIPHTCCEYYRFLRCVDEAYSLIAKCQKESETFLDFVRSIFDDITNLACAEYVENSDKCEQLPILPLHKWKPEEKRPKSFLLPLIDIWTKTSNIQKNSSSTNIKTT